MRGLDGLDMTPSSTRGGAAATSDISDMCRQLNPLTRSVFGCNCVGRKWSALSVAAGTRVLVVIEWIDYPNSSANTYAYSSSTCL